MNSKNKEENEKGVKDTFSFNFKKDPETIGDQFNLSEDRVDEMQVGFKKAMRKVAKNDKGYFSSDELVKAYGDVATTKDEFAYAMYQAGLMTHHLRDEQQEALGSFGDMLARVIHDAHTTKRRRNSGMNFFTTED